jgi:hypothetical protein
MRVQLWIERAAHSMPIRRRDQPAGVLEPCASLAAPNEHRRLLEVAERAADRLLVAVHQRPRHLGGRDREQHAHRLRRTERQIERRD